MRRFSTINLSIHYQIILQEQKIASSQIVNAHYKETSYSTELENVFIFVIIMLEGHILQEIHVTGLALNLTDTHFWAEL